MVKVTVLLTSYNHADYIEKSINSILNQTFKDYEFYIIDDCSTDNSWDIINKYNDKRIIKIKNKINMGSILNPELVRKFKGEYIAIAHCDDYWEPEKLAKQVKYLDQNEHVAACFTHVKLIDDYDNEVSVDNYVDFNLENRTRFEWLNYFFYKGNCLCHPSLMIRKKVQLNDNLFVYGMGACPDFYRWVKLCLKHDIYVYPEKLTCFRVRRSGMNTSGYNYNNIIRSAYDNSKVLYLYKSLSKEEFVNVFPNSKKFFVNNYFNSNFALARICIDEISNGYSIYFGLNCIFELLQNKKIKQELKKNYKYTIKNFINETGKYDVFKIIEKNFLQTSSIFYSFDGIYSEERKLSKQVLIRSDGSFNVLFNNLNLNVANIRFDPDEFNYRLYKDVKIFINGEETNFNTNASIIEGNTFKFYHTDPIFEINYKGEINEIYIIGKTQILETSYLLEEIKKMTKEEVLNDISLRKKLNKIKNKIKNKAKKIFY